jgi:hypothetical protein
MALTSRPQSEATRQPGAPTPSDAASPTGAQLHLRTGGEVVIDLTADGTQPTTDIRVDHVDSDLRAAELSCQDCHFRFAQRLRLTADDRTGSADDTSGKGKGRRFRRR